MASISQLFVDFRVSTDKFQSDLRQAQREIKEFEKSIRPSKDVLLALSAAAATAGAIVAGSAAALVSMAKNAADYGDKIRDAGIRTGLTTSMLSGLKVMAEQNGSSLDELSNGLKFLSKNFIAATDGGNEQQKAFAKLGIGVNELKAAHGNLEPVMLKVMDRLKEMPDGAEKTAVQLALLGRNGIALTEMFSQGSASVENYIELTKLLGTSVTPEAAAAADAFNDSLNILDQAMRGFSVTVGNELLPALTEVVKLTSAIVITAKDLVVEFLNLARGASIAAQALYGTEGLKTLLGALAYVFPGVAKAAVDVSVNYAKLGTMTNITADATRTLKERLEAQRLALEQTTEVAKRAAEGEKKYAEWLDKRIEATYRAQAASRKLADSAIDDMDRWGQSLKEGEEAFRHFTEVNQELRARMLSRISNLEVQSVADMAAGLKGQADAAMAAATARTKQETQTAEIVAEIWDENFDQNVERLNRGTREQQKAAESYQRIWEQATANITSDFVKGLSDVIFHAKNFGQAMKDIALKTAESMFQAFLTGLLAPLTTELSKLGGKLADVLTGKSSASGGGGSPGGSSTGGGGTGARGGLGGLFDQGQNVNGWLQAAEQVRKWFNMIGAGRRAANEVVKSQNSVWDSIAADFKARNTNSLASLQQTRARIDQQFADWQRNIDAFAASDPNNQKVANQAFATLSPQIANLRRQLDENIAKLGGGFGTGGSGIPGTGLAASASTIFAAAVDRMVPAFDSLIAAITGVEGRGGTQLTVTNEFAPAFTFYGVPESLQQQIREQIEPQLISDMQDNTRGITEKIKDILGL